MQNESCQNEEYTHLGQRRFLNVLVTGHRMNRMGEARDGVAKKVQAALRGVLDVLSQKTLQQGRQFRLFSGSADGTDAMAWAWWRDKAQSQDEHGAYYCVSPTPPDWLQELQKLQKLSREGVRSGILAVDSIAPAEGVHGPWHAISDDYKLLMADLLVAVWDGQPPRGCEGGTVRLIHEALRRRTPVLWIRGDAAHVGDLMSERQDPMDTVLLDISPEQIPEHFQLCTLEAVVGLVQRLCQPAEKVSGPMVEADPGQRKTWAGFWHTLFFRLLSPLWRIKPILSPVRAWRGPDALVQGSRLGKAFWQSFDGLDRVATHYANLHRDAVVWSHLLSSLAVFGAVAGAIAFLAAPDSIWASFELLTLLGVGAIVWFGQPKKRHAAWRDRWMLGRQAAEAMRVSALLYPQMASLPALYRLSEHGKDIDLQGQARMLAIQRLRDAEPPQGEQGQPYFLKTQFSPLKKALKGLLDDQMSYHRKTAQRYESTHRRLKWLTNAVFFLALGTVIVHLAGVLDHVRWIEEQDWLLFLTAYFPALAAALESIAIEFELGRLAHNSETMQKKLQVHRDLLDSCRSEADFLTLRRLAIRTAETLYAEHDGWVGLMDIHQLGIPA
ncbi:hypothetical protein [Acidithiobacillus marinus]|uniref:hypothetical protein n=1 Tax=Acidithiobacillus marinus TaxID=187490 RepID=UPI00117BCC1E|nr:hypothetical protein [Acidithiobacillus marinus]